MGNTTFRNWNGSSQCHPSRVYTPRTEEDIRKIVQKACDQGKRLRVVGRSVHTYGSISMCDDGDLIVSMAKYDKLVKVDKKAKTVTAQGGMPLEDLLIHLERKDTRLALMNMGEIAEQSLAGVTATGTHGSGGGRHGKPDSFSDQVVSYKIMECTPEGRVRTIHRGDRDFTAFQTHLGALAIILEVKLQLVDWYHLEWKVADIGPLCNLTTAKMLQRQQESFSCSYTYFPSTDQVVEVVRDITSNPFESRFTSEVQDDFVSTLRQGATRWLSVCPCFIEQYAQVQKRALLSLKGSDMWRKVLSQGDLWGGVNLTIMTDLEYAVPISNATKALQSIRTILRRYEKLLNVVGVRFIQGSPALLASHYSPSKETVFAYINVQLRTKEPPADLTQAIEKEIMKLGGRPHWGKLNNITLEGITKYSLWPSPNVKAFVAAKKRYDPKNILGNSYLDGALGITSVASKGKKLGDK